MLNENGYNKLLNSWIDKKDIIFKKLVLPKNR